MTKLPYGERVDAAEVSYEPHGFAVHDGSEVVTAPYYFRVSDLARVVWVNPSNQESVGPRGFFALYTGADDAYEAIVPEAA